MTAAVVEKYLFPTRKHLLGEVKVELWTVDTKADKRMKMLGVCIKGLYGNVEAK